VVRAKTILLSFIIGFILLSFPFSATGRNVDPPGVEGRDSISGLVKINDLIQKAQNRGTVRILVELDLSFFPEGKLPSQMAVQQQRMSIRQAQQALLQNLRLEPDRLVRKFKFVPQLVIEANPSQIVALSMNPRVRSIHEDKLVGLDLALSVPYIGANHAWLEGYTGAGQVVAVLDSGIDSDHEFLNGKVLSEACYSNAGGLGEGTTLCPNGLPVQIGSGAAINCSIAIPGCEHGTHVAGIAVGSGVTFSGVAPGADLIAIQVFTEFEDPICFMYGQPNTPCIMTYLYSDLISGLERVYELRETFEIAAVNLSLGGGYYDIECFEDPLNAIIDTLRSVEIATIVASGNSGFTDAIGTPACVPAAISVASIDLFDQVSIFSSVASFLDFYAPGDGIYSSLPNDAYGYREGTSMAAPHVAGAWAVIKSKIPHARVDFIHQVLAETSPLVDDLRPGGSVTGIPRIQLDEAIDRIVLIIYPVVRNQTPP
jgi:subtilisin